jgi:prepilin-type N-terminal cleavage/methylation domain-containing protein
MRTTRSAFTLIELLIVVAIIAILALIAVPNFLEAQTRAKVSRTEADMRSLATAIEAYRVDNNNYPLPTFANSTNGDTDSTFEIDNAQQGVVSMWGNKNITTPIAYITTLPHDGFSPDASHWFGYCTINESQWILTSLGPNLTRPEERWKGWQGGDIEEVRALEEWDYPLYLHVYDPTNGTVSAGDIYRSNVNLLQRGPQ